MPWPTDMPPPRMEGYSYTLPTVLHRTNFSDGSRWQRQPIGWYRRQFTVSYDVDMAMLKQLMDFIHDEGYGESPNLPYQPDWWISVPLLSGETTDGSLTPHIVRIIADPKITRLDALEDFIVELTFEDQGPPTYADAFWPLP